MLVYTYVCIHIHIYTHVHIFIYMYIYTLAVHGILFLLVFIWIGCWNDFYVFICWDYLIAMTPKGSVGWPADSKLAFRRLRLPATAFHFWRTPHLAAFNVFHLASVEDWMVFVSSSAELIHRYAYTYMYMCTCIHIYIYVYIYMSSYMYTYTHIHVYIYIKLY